MDARRPPIKPIHEIYEICLNHFITYKQESSKYLSGKSKGNKEDDAFVRLMNSFINTHPIESSVFCITSDAAIINLHHFYESLPKKSHLAMHVGLALLTILDIPLSAPKGASLHDAKTIKRLEKIVKERVEEIKHSQWEGIELEDEAQETRRQARH